MGSSHGAFEFSVVDQIQIGACSGEWNEEAAVECCNVFKNVVSSICNKPWASISDIRNWNLGVPDTERHFQELHRWAEYNNQTHKVVISNNPIQLYQISLYQKFWNKVKVYYAKNIDDAINWLKSENFEFDDEQVKNNFFINESLTKQRG